MILYGVGMGPGDKELVTLKALNVLSKAQAVFEPVSAKGRVSVAGQMARDLIKGLKTIPILFPMTGSDEELRAGVRESLTSSKDLWEGAKIAAMPVIGDSALYATVHVLHQELSSITETELRLIPGISAHSAAAARLNRFIAMRDQVFSVVPGSKDIEGIIKALKACQCAALYKPSALGENLPLVISASGPWDRIVRLHRVGLEGEFAVEGDAAAEPTDDYLAVMLLWR
ncbi:precorrin-2 methylase [Thermanaerovibrio velox DSM 12556]|uniref:Precorrin-2 methylase n=1 Tax=Thermanaerovibrio velox DSM 12556 TaxID=926567 RepID=H0UMW0_9BACT|nr:precorrin-2 C(20)-methyltransferase [Thermanaerovibrio velox]EHM09255.1 precorrin-2 methylase [Thermanaerovibrio velox DSM 12556]